MYIVHNIDVVHRDLVAYMNHGIPSQSLPDNGVRRVQTLSELQKRVCQAVKDFISSQESAMMVARTISKKIGANVSSIASQLSQVQRGVIPLSPRLKDGFIAAYNIDFSL